MSLRTLYEHDTDELIDELAFRGCGAVNSQNLADLRYYRNQIREAMKYKDIVLLYDAIQHLLRIDL